MRRVAIPLALTALLAGCGGHHHQMTSSGPGGSLGKAYSCHTIKHARCALLTVPLDHSGKLPGKLKLVVAMAGPSKPPRGVVLFLSGGPGEAGVPFLPRTVRELAPALKGYRVVVLDQRGTGARALDCPALQRAAGGSDLTVPPRGAVAACAKRIGERRRFFTTRDTVADLEALRMALGVERWALDGISYGTFVAERYALAHPGNVNRLVLDSVVPQEGIQPFQLETMHAVPRVLRAACAAQHCGSDPASDLAAVVRARHDGPELLDALVTLSLADPTYRAVPGALSEARAGRPAHLDRVLVTARRDERLPATFLSQGLHASTACADFPEPWGGPSASIPARKAAIQRAAARLTPATIAPFDMATATGNGELITCEQWPAEPVRVSAPRQDLPNVPVLLLAGDRDLSTPLEWAQREARHATRGRLLVVRRAGHSVQDRAKDPAERAAVVRLLQSP